MQEVRSVDPVTSASRQEAKPGLLTGSLVEALGSFFIVLAGLGVTMLNPQAGIAPALAFGLALFAAIAAFGHLSGGYFNPALTLGLAMGGRTPWKAVLPFIVAQVVGALAAAGLFWLIFSAHPQQIQIAGLFSSAANGYAENSATQFPLASVLLIEVVAAALLTAVLLGSTGRLASRAAAPFAVGLSYAVLITVLAPIDNGALNPARSTAAAVFSDSWGLQQLWVFWVAPLLGAIIAGLLYRSFELSRRTQTVEESSELHDERIAGDSKPAPSVAGSAAAAATVAAHREDARTFFDGATPADEPRQDGHDDEHGHTDDSDGTRPQR